MSNRSRFKKSGRYTRRPSEMDSGCTTLLPTFIKALTFFGRKT
jgi:hypothetical protein